MRYRGRQFSEHDQQDQFVAGSDPVSAIAGSISSVANLIGQKQQRKMLAEQRQSEKIKTFLTAQQNRQQIASQHVMDRQRQQKRQHHLNTILTASLILLVGLAIVFAI